MKAEHLERILALASVPELADLHPDDLATLADRAAPREWEGDNQARPQDPGACLLLSGSLETASGRIEKGPALLGAIEALAGEPLRLRAAPGQAAQTAWISRRDLSWVLADVFEIWLAMLRHAATRWIAEDPGEAEKVAVHRLVSGREEVSLVNRIRMLSECGVFSKLRVYALARVASQMQDLRLSAGDELWGEGRAASQAFLLVDGVLEHDPEGTGPTVLANEPGSMLGLRHLLAGTEHPNRVWAAADSRVLRLEREMLIDELEDDPDAAAQLLETVARLTHQAIRGQESRS